MSATARANSGCASQMRTSTVGNAWCGRTLHQISVCSRIERVAIRKRTKRSYSSQLSSRSGMPQRGKKRVKICVRVDCRWVWRPSSHGELHDAARSSGRTERSALVTAIARSAPRMPVCTWMPKVLLRQAT